PAPDRVLSRHAAGMAARRAGRDAGDGGGLSVTARRAPENAQGRIRQRPAGPRVFWPALFRAALFRAALFRPATSFQDADSRNVGGRPSQASNASVVQGRPYPTGGRYQLGLRFSRNAVVPSCPSDE